MKKALSLLLMLCMLVSVVAPTLVFAEADGKTVTVNVGDVPVAFDEQRLALLADGNSAFDATSFSNEGLVGFENKGFVHTDGADAAVEATFEIVLDLGEVQTIGSISLDAYKETNSMIALPTVDYYVSVDGENYYHINAGNAIVPAEYAPERATSALTADFTTRIAVNAQYVKAVVSFTNGWLFLSELSVGAAVDGIAGESPDKAYPYSEHSVPQHGIGVFDDTDGELDLSENDIWTERLFRNAQLIKAAYDAEADAYRIIYSKVNPWPDGHTGTEILNEGEILVAISTTGVVYDDDFAGCKWISRGLTEGDYVVLNDGMLRFYPASASKNDSIVKPEAAEFVYIIYDGEATITGYNGDGGNVVIPSEIDGYPVVSIGYDAFSYNDSILNVVISEGIKFIKNDAFEECHYLQSVAIPDSVVSIERWAFGWCYELTEITIPASVEYMASEVFTQSHSLQNIYCEATSRPKGWDSRWAHGCDATIWFDGIVYERPEFYYEIYDGEVTITGYTGDGGDVVIPSEIDGCPVVAIGYNAFSYNSSISSIVIPDSVVSISSYAFGWCYELTEITIPASVEYMGSEVFAYSNSLQSIYCEAASMPEGWENSWTYNCDATIWFDDNKYQRPEFYYERYDSEVTIIGYNGDGGNVVIPSEIDGCPVVGIGSNAFSYNGSVLSVVIPDSVRYIESNAFGDCYILQSVVIPDSVVSIGSHAFSWCSELTEITIPASVEYMGSEVFAYSNSLQNIYCEATSMPDGWASRWAHGCDATIWFDGIKYEKPEYYYEIYDGEATIIGYNGEAGNVVIPSEIDGCPVVTIGYDAFSRKNFITSVVIPDSVKYIENGAFGDCHYLQSVVIPDNVVSIGSYAFGWCYELTEITLPASIEYMGEYVFTQNYSLQNIYCEATSQPEGWDSLWADGCNATIWFDGIKYEKPEYLYEIYDGEVTITGYIGAGGDVVIPSEIDGCPVVTIGYDAFSYNDSILSVVIPDSVKYIEDDAFEECHYLQSVVIPDSVVSIGRWAFGWCYELTEITIPASVEYMSNSVFTQSHSLQNIYCEAASQPEGWDSFWADSCNATIWFDGVKVEKPEYLYEIYNGEVTITGYIGAGGDVVIPSEIDGCPVVTIGCDAFSYNDSILSVVIPDSVKDIADNAFEECRYLQSVVLSDGLLEIGARAFIGCSELTEITIPDSVTSIGYSAFYFCDSLTSILIPDSVTSIGNYAFVWCSSLTNVVIPDSVTSMGEMIFFECYSLTDIYCEATSQPDGWSDLWNFGSDATVHWGVKPPVTYGDVNGDGTIDGKDATRLLQYLANYDYASGTSTVEISDGADCNGDGIIDGRDSVRLLQYLANFDPVTGGSSVTFG